MKRMRFALALMNIPLPAIGMLHNALAPLIIMAKAQQKKVDNSSDTLIAALEKNETAKAIKLLTPTNIHIKNKGGLLPLIQTIFYGNVTVLEAMLALNPDLEQQDRYKNTALCTAIAWQRKEAIDLLLKAGASQYTKGHLGYYPLTWAVLAGDGEIALKLLNLNPKKDVINQATKIARLTHADNFVTLLQNFI